MSTRALDRRTIAAIWFVLGILAVLVACTAMACGSTDHVVAAGATGQIVFSARADPTGDSGGGWQLFVTNADGSALKTLTSFDGYGDRWPVWSPDGEMVAFHRCCRDDGLGGEEADIWLVDRDGGDERRLVHGFAPAWSPDGSQIVFTRYAPTDAPNDEEVYDIWLVEVETGRERRLLRNAKSPDWSPDDEHILVQSNTPQAEGLHVVRVDSGETRALTRRQGDSCASWSPDGEHIAYVALDDGEVYVMSADGRKVRRVSKFKEGRSTDACPAWSPDGTQVVYSKADPAVYFQNDRELIFVVGADGTGQRRISPDRDLVKDGSPEWSPDGAKIVFANNKVGELWVMDPDGSGRKELVSGPFAELYEGLDWSRASDPAKVPSSGA